MSVKLPYIKLSQYDKDIYLTKMTAKLLCDITYVAERAKSTEEGAVQRVLNQQRISKIKDFTLSAGIFPSSIVINWISSRVPIKIESDHIEFMPTDLAAQLIDGQHRIAGIKEAIVANPKVGDLEIPVSIYVNLDTQGCADIFISINTEQRPVSPSLVYDLYGVASKSILDHDAERARDIAIFLNTEESSPLFEEIKFPGSKRRKNGIPLSSVVNSLKQLVKDKGILEQIGVTELERQKKTVLNYFTALERKYDKEWDSTKNVFLYAAGFSAAIEFLKNNILIYCKNQKSFEIETISKVINLKDLILQEEVRSLSGKAASDAIYERLKQAFDLGKVEDSEYKF